MYFLMLLIGLAAADDIVTLEKGERAPFEGTLLSPSAAAKIIVDSDYSLEKCKIDSEKKLVNPNYKKPEELVKAGDSSVSIKFLPISTGKMFQTGRCIPSSIFRRCDAVSTFEKVTFKKIKQSNLN